MRTLEIWVLLRHPLHSKVLLRKLAMDMRPQRLQTWTVYASETSKRRSRRNWKVRREFVVQSVCIGDRLSSPHTYIHSHKHRLHDDRTLMFTVQRKSNKTKFHTWAAPWAIWQSRSISPKRRPPSRDRPSIGCRLRIWTGPRARLCILSSTICFNRW